LPTQYTLYVEHLVQGDLGTSIHTGRPVTSDLASFWPPTVELTLASLLLAIVFGVPLGVVAAVKKDRLPDRVLRWAAILGLSVPEFLLGVVFIYVFYSRLQWIPAPSGLIDPNVAPPSHITGMYVVDSVLTGNGSALDSSLRHLLAPALTLAFVTTAPIIRLTRAVMIDVLASDYIRAARAYGAPSAVLILRYGLKNALPPILNLIGVIFGYLLGGAVLVEAIYSRPGLGRYAVDSIQTGDFASIQAFVLVATLSYVAVNLVVDVLNVVVDKRAT
jgi:peptide/nickel transport system permease protein